MDQVRLLLDGALQEVLVELHQLAPTFRRHGLHPLVEVSDMGKLVGVQLAEELPVLLHGRLAPGVEPLVLLVELAKSRLFLWRHLDILLVPFAHQLSLLGIERLPAT
jgi:hypothetical protein